MIFQIIHYFRISKRKDKYMDLFNNSLYETPEDIFGIDDNDECIIEFAILNEDNILLKSDSNLNAFIEVRPDDARYKYKPYFKVSKGKNGWNGTKADDKVRISLIEPKYEDHQKYPGNWRLGSKERKKLIKDLQKPFDNNHTVFDEIKRQAAAAGADPKLMIKDPNDYKDLR